MAAQVEADYFVTFDAPVRAIQLTISLHGIVSDAILGVGRIQKEPVVLDVQGTDAIGIRKMGVMSLSFDHRLVDGATADLFMADVKKTLETWNVNP